MPYRELQRAVEGRLDEILMNFEPASMNAAVANLQNVEIKVASITYQLIYVNTSRQNDCKNDTTWTWNSQIPLEL